MPLLSPDHLRLAKQIIRGAAEVGLDEAGTRLCGSAWPAIKKILSPVMDELDRRFPALTLADTTAAKEAAEKAADALDKDQALQAMLAGSFERLTEQQQAILDQLARNGARLDQIGEAVIRASESSDQGLDAIRNELRKLNLKVDLSLAADDPTAGLTPDEVPQRLAAQNSAALASLDAGDVEGAASELADARKLGESGLRRWSGDPDIAVALGFIEKTQSEVDSGDHPERAVASLSKAASYFAQGAASASVSAQLGGLNGMASVYILRGDYDLAIQIGEVLFRTAPSYGYAVYDYALALEAKRYRDGDDAALLQRLADVYKALLPLMADPVQRFAANLYADVLGKSQAVDAALASAASTQAPVT